ncbi:hypothetical protein M9Y10_023519 [Tritrichomonas musculus]|uniref:Chromo domain-containing protein n=1 Tax=Tritrichomonas musculus TaxID=1915356 RepID=A0ABR2KVY4_9EUKA
MNYEEFMKYTSPDNDESSVQYVLDMRTTDQVEYLVRYNDPKFKYDEWVKASDLTCYKKIIDYHDKKVPKNIVKNPKPENIINEMNQVSPDINDDFKIYDIMSVNDEVMLKVHIPGEPGIINKKSTDLKEYTNEIVKFYEEHCFEGQ